MARTSFTFALCWVVIMGLAGCADHPAKSSGLLQLNHGMALNEVQSILGAPGEHQFSAQLRDDDLLCLNYAFDDPMIRYYLVFTNGVLSRIVDPPWVNYESILITDGPNKGYKRRGRRLTGPEQQMHMALQANDLLKAGLDESLTTKKHAVEERNKGLEPWNIAPVLIAIAPFIIAESPVLALLAAMYSSLASHFDPMRVHPGLSIEAIDRIYGEPLMRQVVLDDGVARLYGGWVGLPNNENNHRVGLLVVFVDDRATRVYSHDFFDERLIEENTRTIGELARPLNFP